MPSTIDLLTGATITAATSSWTAFLTGIDWSGIARESVETTHLGTAAAGAGKFGNKTFLPADTQDPGEIQLSGFLDTATRPPIGLVAETWTITFPTGNTWAASGFVTAFDWTGTLDENMTFTMTIKCSGNVTVT